MNFSEWIFQGFTVALGDCGQGRFRSCEHFSQAGILALGWGSYLYRSSQSHVHFQPEACVTSVTKVMAQRLENWKAVLGQYRYAIEHIPGERNCWCLAG